MINHLNNKKYVFNAKLNRKLFNLFILFLNLYLLNYLRMQF